MLRHGVIVAGVSALVTHAVSAEITGARYLDQTNAYGHGAVQGGEYSALEVDLADGRVITVAIPEGVFEDTAPRLVDFDKDGTPEVLTVFSGFDSGAALQIWDEIDDGTGSTLVRVTQTDPIGQRHRWLAIAGAADLDADGRIEIAYVDRPHLAKVLRVVEVTDRFQLRDEAAATGFTNHHLGDAVIEGGVFDCGHGPEILTADADWRRVLATRLEGGALISRDIGPYEGPTSLEDCQ